MDMDAELVDEQLEINNKPQKDTSDKLKPKKGLKPILQKLSLRRPLKVDWLGTSFGVTQNLFGFWSKSGYQPIYIRQTANALTGEHTTVMLKPLESDQIELREF